MSVTMERSLRYTIIFFKAKYRIVYLQKESNPFTCKFPFPKMLNIANYERNANQNYREVSPHSSQNGYRQKSLQIINGCEKN